LAEGHPWELTGPYWRAVRCEDESCRTHLAIDVPFRAADISQVRKQGLQRERQATGTVYVAVTELVLADIDADRAVADEGVGAGLTDRPLA
jgi:hypothetical protein